MPMPIGCMYTWTEHVFRMPSPIWDVIPATSPPRVGIDVLSFGGTKNGWKFGEAVVFFNPEVAKEVQYIRKQLMQLHSKTRFIAAQFSAVLKHDLWLKTAGHANRMGPDVSQRSG